MTLLNNLIKVGGSAVILKEIADRVLDTRISREQTLRRNRAGMLALGVVIGSAAGAVAGVLFAPKSGKETREELSRYSCETWEKMKDNAAATGHRLVDTVEEKGSRMRTAAEKGVDAARESFKDLSGASEEGNS